MNQLMTSAQFPHSAQIQSTFITAAQQSWWSFDIGGGGVSDKHPCSSGSISYHQISGSGS